jgi:hypothetical protein
VPGAGVLPTFFVIGAAKAGTTSLHLYLGEHPDIEMSRVKEPQIFAGADCAERLAEYDGLFPGEAPQRGESSAVYSQHPRWPGVPERIAEHVPDARFVYLVRDPVERAIAHWAQHVADRKEERSLEDALADWERPDSLYLCPSRYATQLGRYLECFESERILVVDQRDLLEDRVATVARVLGFLGVDSSFRSPRFAEEMNPGAEKRADTGFGERLRATPGFERARRLPLPDPVRRGLRGLVSKPVQREELDPVLRERIERSLRDEVARLREHTGQAFASWSV